MYTLATPGSILNKIGHYDFSNLGSLYSEVALMLAGREEWTVRTGRKASGRFHLILGEAQAGNIHFKMLAGYGSLYPGLTPLCNFYRGFNLLCRKVTMVKTLREYFVTLVPSDGGEGALTPRFEDICPESFMFFPAKPEDSERDEFISVASRLEADESSRVVWIVKPSDGCKGHSIRLFSSHAAVLDFIHSQTEGSISWVVQRYIDNPLLIPAGQRKFDIRVWVLLDAEYCIHVYRRGALRVASESYMASSSSADSFNGLADLSNIHAHLSNHCIAETHPDYGRYEPTNEIWYDEFQQILLDMTDGEVDFARDVMPQIHNAIRHSLLAVKDRLQGPSAGGYKSFNVFGYDFMLSREWNKSEQKQQVKVWLIEINSSPAVAEDLLVEFAEDLLEVVVDPFFPPSVVGVNHHDERERTVTEEGFCEGSETYLTNSSICKNISSSRTNIDNKASLLFPRGFECIYSGSDKSSEQP